MSTRLVFRWATPFVIVSIFLLALGALAAWYVASLQKAASNLLTDNIASIRAGEELAIDIREIQLALDRFTITRDQKLLKGIPTLTVDARKWLTEVDKLAADERERSLVIKIQNGFAYFEKQFEVLEQGHLADAERAAHDLSDAWVTREMLTPAQEYLDLSEDVVAKSGRENQSSADRMAQLLLLLGVAGCVAGVLAGIVLAQRLRRDIIQLHVPIRDATGRLAEVIGPIDLAAKATGADLRDTDAVLRGLAEQVGTVVDRLQKSQREVLRAEQLAGLGTLAAGLAHEIRNPLTAMKILIQTAAEDPSGNGLHGRDLSVVAEEVQRLERATQTFLDFARPPGPDKRWFDARSVVQSTLDLIGSRASRQLVNLDPVFPESPMMLHADFEQFRQVLLNILLNALDAMPEGGRIQVQLALEPSAISLSERDHDTGGLPSTLIIEIADNGPGISHTIAPRIFQPFVTSKDGGLGLGLAICRRIIEDHGGGISVANASGGGAVFTVTVPVSAEPSTSAENKTVSSPTLAAS